MSEHAQCDTLNVVNSSHEIGFRVWGDSGLTIAMYVSDPILVSVSFFFFKLHINFERNWVVAINK